MGIVLPSAESSTTGPWSESRTRTSPIVTRDCSPFSSASAGGTDAGRANSRERSEKTDHHRVIALMLSSYGCVSPVDQLGSYKGIRLPLLSYLGVGSMSGHHG